MQPGADGIEKRRKNIVDKTWNWVNQVHGNHVVLVNSSAQSRGETGDALVSDDPGSCLSVLVADCVPLGLGSKEGIFAAVHAGWRGVVSGIIQKTADVMRQLGASEIAAFLGPAIHSECYEFGSPYINRMVAVFGQEVLVSTRWGTVGLDLPLVVKTALGRADIELLAQSFHCTACSGEYFSHRAGGDKQRQAFVVWRT
ncbi:MAG: polyphenol oxidase family protein [Actinobacteria bacterium]|nr:polyphenol oxidase family protein [Actinomycetota bacterium]MCL6105329.1 polyphenol oxidase family protein [Actinomycetota bacterium]